MTNEKKVTEWHFKESLPEENIPKLLWKAILSAKDGSFEVPPALREHLPLTPGMVVNAIEKGTSPLLTEMSKTTLLYYTSLLYIHEKCVECFASLISSLKGHSSLPIILQMLAEKEENVPFLKEAFKRAVLQFLDAAILLPRDVVEKFFDELYSIAKNDVGERQYKALSILADFVDRPEVERLFLMFADDWDPQVRRISIRALKSIAHRKEVKERARALLRTEEDPVNKALLEQIIRL